MIKQFYRFALALSLFTFILCISKGIALFTSFIRSALVYIGILFTFFIAGHLLKWSVSMNNREGQTDLTTTKEANEEIEEFENED